MSNTSTVYDRLRTVVGGVIGSSNELSGPNWEAKESDLRLDAGWLVEIGGASRRTNDPKTLGTNWQFPITLTTRWFGTETDISKYNTAAKSLVDSWTDVMKAIETDDTLTGNDIVAKVDFLSHNGVEFLDLDREGVLVLESAVSAVIFNVF